MAEQSRSSKDKEMAARLKKDPKMCERWTGICPVCNALIRNVQMFNHMSAHARGADRE